MTSGYDTAPEGRDVFGAGEQFGAQEAMSTLSASEQTARGELSSPRSRRLKGTALAVYGVLCVAVCLAKPSAVVVLSVILLGAFFLLATLAERAGRQARRGVVDKPAARRSDRQRSRWLPDAAIVVYGFMLFAVKLTHHLAVPVRLGVLLACALLVAAVLGLRAGRRSLDGNALAGVAVLFGWFAVMDLSRSAVLLISACFCFLLSFGELLAAHRDARGASQ